MRDVEFAIGLFDHAAARGITADDLDGSHGDVLRTWQTLGFIARAPGMHPFPSCPHCDDGTPYRLGGRTLCNACGSSVDRRHLLLWPLDRHAMLGAIAGHFRLRGGVQRIEDCLWQLGTGDVDGEPVECFYRRHGTLSAHGQRRLAAYRRVLALHAPDTAHDHPQFAQWAPLLALFTPDGSLAPTTLGALLQPRGSVRFELQSGALWVGDTLLGEVPVGSREYHLLACLAAQLDYFVPYSDLKCEVLRRAGGADETDEATFCHALKRRIKKRWVAEIDRLVATTNKGDGYRLRGVWVER